MADPRDPEEAARIRAALDQGSSGLREPEVNAAMELWEKQTAELAFILHRHLPENAVPGLLGGLFAIFMRDAYDGVLDASEEEFFCDVCKDDFQGSPLDHCGECGRYGEL